MAALTIPIVNIPSTMVTSEVALDDILSRHESGLNNRRSREAHIVLQIESYIRRACSEIPEEKHSEDHAP